MLIDANGKINGKRPVIMYGEKPIFEISLDGDFSNVVSWRAAIANDFCAFSSPMCRTIEGIEIINNKAFVPIETKTKNYIAACNGESETEANFELVGLNANSETIYYKQFPIVCKMPIDPVASGDIESVKVTTLTPLQVSTIAQNAVQDAATDAATQATARAEAYKNAAEGFADDAKDYRDEASAIINNFNPVVNHSDLQNRDAADAHPMTAITGLQEAIDGIDTAIDGIDTTLANKADLVNGIVPANEMPIAYKNGTLSELGGVKIDNTYASGRYGLIITSSGILKVFKASYTKIDEAGYRNKQPSNNSSQYGCIDVGNLDYAVRSVLPNITTIPADAANVNLYDASATNNNHSYIYKHSPDTAPTYELPAVTDETIAHNVVISVTFSATALSVIFTSNGVLATWDKNITPKANETWTFLCRWVNNNWRVYPIQEG